MFGLPEEGLFLKSGLRRRHHGHDPACKLGLAQRTPRPEERAHLEEDPVRLGVLRREAHERARVLKPPFEVWRPLAARLRIDEISHRAGPWGFEKRLDFTDERLGEPIERIIAPAPRLEEAPENVSAPCRRGPS